MRYSYYKFFFALFFIGGCPDPQGADQSEASGLTADAGAKQNACVLDVECATDELCIDGFCVATDDTADGGPVAGTFDSGMGAGETTANFDAGQADAEPNPNPWLLSVNGSSKSLVKIDVVTGESATVCYFSTDYAGYPSTTFGLNGTLYGWNGLDNTLDIIDPCTCDVTVVGVTQDASGVIYDNVPGITADGNKVETLFGLSTDQDKLLELDVATGGADVVGPLGVDFHYSGTTWSVELEGLYAINDYTDKLYVLDTETGAATDVADLDLNFDMVGIEYHIGDQSLYTCTNANFSALSKVYRVNVETGATTPVADLSYRCNNLAAPWTPVACIDNLEMASPMPPMP